ncbi:MAG: hypothetical protein COB08_007220 [Rhodobacteraceae bacterium]|nr:hypothetical protein [Paracoccaceae bacterium]
MTRYILVFGAFLAGCSAAPAPSLPDGKNRVVDIVNTAETPLQFTAVSAERRGLVRQPGFMREVAAQYYLTLNFDDGSGACLFDFRAKFSGGQVAEAKRFDTCAETSWVVRP